MAVNFQNVRILFLSVKLFNYEDIIANKLRALGAVVDYYDERPNNSIFTKGVIRLYRGYYQRKIKKYYRQILKEISDKKFDYFFLIKGEVVPEFFIIQVKELNQGIILLYYTFDSFLNNFNGLKLVHRFDRKFTFDSKDAEKYNLSFRPLFFSDVYREINQTSDTDIDLLFIGTAHSDRYIISEYLSDWCQRSGFKSYSYYYSPSKFVFWFFKFFNPSFKKFKFEKITFKNLDHKQIIDLYRRSKVVLDINHPNQNGLTMRVFEALGSGLKIITTNEEIVRYPFYNSDNVFIVDRKKLTVDKAFFARPFRDIDKVLYEKMSIEGWLEELFFDNYRYIWLGKSAVNCS
jgi:hypothetical protein